MQVPDTEFAHCGEIQIAYQVFGSGPIELVICGGPAGHIEVYWDEPGFHEWFERVSRFARVAIFDRRGTGASDAAEDLPTNSQYMQDLRAVIDACGFQRPALLGAVEASRMCALFAATYPERIQALILVDTSAAGGDVLDEEAVSRMEAMIDERWGKGDVASIYAPTAAQDEPFRRWFARLERLSASPRGARQILELARRADVTDALGDISCPTLVLHHRGNAFVPVELGRAVARAIPGARFAVIEGQDSLVWLGDVEALMGEMEEFLTGSRTPAPCSQLAAILFTDIVGSTELAARLHHAQWQRLLREHDKLVCREIELCGGTVIKELGDGFLAVFATPDRALRAARAAVAASTALGLRLRAGIHAGAIERTVDDVRGIAVHIASRITECARPGQVLVSGTVRDILIDSELALAGVCEQPLRGVPGRWPLFELRELAGQHTTPSWARSLQAPDAA